METSTQILSHEKRKTKSKDCVVRFIKSTEKFAYYDALDEDGSIKYIGRIEKIPSLSEYCSCPDQFHRNNESFQNEHGYSMQCKHMIQAIIKRGWNCW